MRSRNRNSRAGGAAQAEEPGLLGRQALETPDSGDSCSGTDGSGFGASQGASGVLIGDLPAPITQWSQTDITAYVPKDAATGTVPVRVVTNGGASNTLPLRVTKPAPAAGRVSWRFRADSIYIMGRPAVGADGTIYAADISGHLYALDRDGGLKWIFNANPGHVVGSVDVGPDGTIYFASLNRVYAVNPDGTQKWTVADAAGGGIFFGPNVGPDGKIYAVSDDVGGGLGAFAISPAGAVVWSSPGFVRFGHTGRNREIRFDATQLYFNANNTIDVTYGLRGFSLDGEQRFVVGGSAQPAVAPNGIIWTPGGPLKGFFADGFSPRERPPDPACAVARTRRLGAPAVGRRPAHRRPDADARPPRTRPAAPSAAA